MHGGHDRPTSATACYTDMSLPAIFRRKRAQKYEATMAEERARRRALITAHWYQQQQRYWRRRRPRRYELVIDAGFMTPEDLYRQDHDARSKLEEED